MTGLLQEMELVLCDLLQSGLATGGAAAAPRLHALALRCEDTGLHTGAALLAELEKGLCARTHTMEKDDLPLAAVLCRTVRYIGLCREKLQEEAIARRWEAEISDATHGTAQQE